MRLLLVLLLWPAIGLARPVPVAATIGLIADMVAQVGGPLVQVSAIVPANAEPHSFEPKPSSLRNLQAAKLLFANGAGFEPFLGKLRAYLPKSATVVLLAEGQLDPGCVEAGREGSNQQAETCNPHYWLDPGYGLRYLERIRQALAQADPVNAAAYTARAWAYSEQIKAVDRETQACLKAIPTAARKVVVQHDAFLHLARKYQITVVGSLANFGGQELGTQSYVRLALQMKQEGIKVIFAEPQFSQAQVKALQEASGARVYTLYSDSLSKDVPGYLQLLRWNSRMLCQAFAM